jgi:hypothetical protein
LTSTSKQAWSLIRLSIFLQPMFPFSAVTSQQHLKVLSHKEARDERALRRRRRQLLEDGHESKQSETNNEVSSPLVSASVILDRKSQMQTTSSVQPHSQTNNSPPESPAPAGEFFVSILLMEPESRTYRTLRSTKNPKSTSPRLATKRRGRG